MCQRHTFGPASLPDGADIPGLRASVAGRSLSIAMAGGNEVLLVRHGETDENASARFQGRIDTRLNARGREQSRALAEAVRGEGLLALYSSPLLRAQETARIVGEAIGLEPILDERLVEADAGAWSGRLIADILEVSARGMRAGAPRIPAFAFPTASRSPSRRSGSPPRSPTSPPGRCRRSS